MWTLTTKALRAVFALNEFALPLRELVVVGLRGCRPADSDDWTKRPAQQLVGQVIDHTHPRCVLLQWVPAEGLFAVFPASTVPHRRYVEAARKSGGKGANRLGTGRYLYARGVHLGSKPTGHAAWRQADDRIYQRTADDLDYDGADRWEAGNPGDNLHAAHCDGAGASYYGSAGCQVVCGRPRCAARGSAPATGAWAVFQARGYAAPNERMVYALFDAAYVKAVQEALSRGETRGLERVRCGSRGVRAKAVQEALIRKGFLVGAADGAFGPKSALALARAQERLLGPLSDDAVCGPRTAAALGVKWA